MTLVIFPQRPGAYLRSLVPRFRPHDAVVAGGDERVAIVVESRGAPDRRELLLAYPDGTQWRPANAVRGTRAGLQLVENYQ